MRPMAPTNPIKPKFACPIVKPKNAKPVHQIATLRIRPACLKEFNAATKAMTMRTKKRITEEKIFDCDSALASASPPTSRI